MNQLNLIDSESEKEGFDKFYRDLRVSFSFMLYNQTIRLSLDKKTRKQFSTMRSKINNMGDSPFPIGEGTMRKYLEQYGGMKAVLLDDKEAEVLEKKRNETVDML